MKINRLKQLVSLFTTILLTANMQAEEGMWLLPDIADKWDILNTPSVNLKSSDIYDPEKPSLSDAIVIFGGYCTGEIISDKGLLLTNHHCGYFEIQQRSTLQNNILQDGFWADSLTDEIPNPDLFVKFLRNIREVTDSIEIGLHDSMSFQDRELHIQEVTDRLIEQETCDSMSITAEVKSFFYDNEYYLLTYQTFTDVRLVGTPPESIGKFGGDTDNWVWPRHTGDFALFRVYTAPDGTPADYHQDNIPLSPRYSFPLSLRGVSENDFTLTLGYPGKTSRYITSGGIELLLHVEHPNRIKLRNTKQDIMRKAMERSPDISLQYASKYARLSNYWKYSIGQSEAIRRHQLLDEKKEQEKDYLQWAGKQGKDSLRYSDALERINATQKQIQPVYHLLQYISESIYMGSELISLAHDAAPLYRALENKKQKEIIKETESLRKKAEEHWRYYDKNTDQLITNAMLSAFIQDIDPDNHPAILQNLKQREKEDISQYTDRMYRRSVFADSLKLVQFLQNPKKIKLKRDPALQTALSFRTLFLDHKEIHDSLMNILQQANRVYMQGLMSMQKEKDFYPEANFTLRATHGRVQAYKPADAVSFDFITTHHGILEKSTSIESAYHIQDDFKDLLKTHQFAKYADKHGNLPVNFITTNDITGGNSGSPVLNSEGHLVGLAFDGNWESMSGDLNYVQDQQRCISVDIRYVLFVLDHYAKASRILNEIKIVP